MRRHVVIIPGYYGSNLRDRVSNVLFWLSQFSLQKPDHTLAGIALPASEGRVFVDGIVDDIPILKIFRIPIYHGLLRFLMHGMGYDQSEVHAIGVDWRRSLTDCIDPVRNAIDDAFTQSGQPVDVIAHSHGGLVARAYLAKHGGDRVSKLITLGTPHIGMLDTFEALVHGLVLLRFNQQQLMTVARGLPSAYELLPVTKDFMTFNNAPASPFDDDGWCADASMKTLLATAVTPALPADVPVPLFAIHGTHSATTTHAVRSGNDVTFNVTDDGDGTVPLASGAAIGITAPAVQRFAVPFGGHAFVFDDRNTQEVIRHILREDAAPPAYFVAAWRDEMYLPNAKNRVVVNLDDLTGLPIPNATVTVRLDGTAHAMPQQANGDYMLDVRMPGAGTTVVYAIEASAPSLPQVFRANGRLVAAVN